MTSPVTGPFIIQVNGGSGTDKSYWSFKRGYRQKPPYNLTLPYERLVARGATLGNPSVGCQAVVLPGMLDAIDWSDASNRLLDKFKDKLGEEAGLAVNILERKQSIAMIASRAGQIAGFLLALKKLDFVRAAKILKLSAVPKGTSVRKSVSSNWLEFHFGWEPLIKDIHASIEILQGPAPPIRVTAGVTLPGSFWYVQPRTSRVKPNAFNDASFYESWISRHISEVGLKCGAQIRVDNPNLWLANQLGLVNPLVVGYNVIPFSFVLDWFVNVEQFLSQGSDFLGLAVEQPWTTKRLKATLDWYHKLTMRWYHSGFYPNDRYVYQTTLDHFLGTGTHVRRSLGLPAVTLKVRPLKLPSWQRALTAVSLVVQRLSR